MKDDLLSHFKFLIPYVIFPRRDWVACPECFQDTTIGFAWSLSRRKRDHTLRLQCCYLPPLKTCEAGRSNDILNEAEGSEGSHCRQK